MDNNDTSKKYNTPFTDKQKAKFTWILTVKRISPKQRLYDEVDKVVYTIEAILWNKDWEI
jgi:hypothetical protein